MQSQQDQQDWQAYFKESISRFDGLNSELKTIQKRVSELSARSPVSEIWERMPEVLKMNEAFQRDFHKEPFDFVTIESNNGEIYFSVPNRRTASRADRLFTKEPDTIQWIETFDDHDTFVDVGANVGTYSIWAACTRGTKVFAFEPTASNFATLQRNIMLNAVSDRLIAWPAALSDRHMFGILHQTETHTGASHCFFGESVDSFLQPFEHPFQQGAISTTLDHMVDCRAIPVPTHIKVDVDGAEHMVVAGAQGTLQNPQLKSIMLECNTATEAHRSMMIELERHGFALDQELFAMTREYRGAEPVANHFFKR